MSSFGEALRAERLAKGIALEQISAVTKIKRRHLEALEEDKINELPGGIITKGIVRGYAGVVGLDVKDVTTRFVKLHGLAEDLLTLQDALAHPPKSPTVSDPPQKAKFLLLLIPPRNREGIIGDLEEEYRTVLLPHYSLQTARFYYWWHAVLACALSLWAAFSAVSQTVSNMIMRKN